ncbi:hypothetical protein BGZ97_009798, partial [Linnemannia gamsii]
MTKASLSPPSGPPPRPVSHQGQPNAGQDGDNQSVSSERSRERDWLRNVFRSSSQKPKATNSTSMSPKSIMRGTSDSAKTDVHRLSGVSTPGSVDIEPVVSATAIKSTPSDVHSPYSPTTPRWDMFPHIFKAPSALITLPKFGA